MDRFIAAASAGLLAYMAALDAGLPAWRHLPIGDATDFGVTAAFVIWFGIKAIAIEARQRTDREDGLDPEGESAGPQDIAQRRSR